MTFDHRATHLHQLELDREIASLRDERTFATNAPGRGPVARARRSAGRVLIAAGAALAGSDDVRLRTRRA